MLIDENVSVSSSTTHTKGNFQPKTGSDQLIIGTEAKPAYSNQGMYLYMYVAINVHVKSTAKE